MVVHASMTILIIPFCDVHHDADVIFITACQSEMREKGDIWQTGMADLGVVPGMICKTVGFKSMLL